MSPSRAVSQARTRGAPRALADPAGRRPDRRGAGADAAGAASPAARSRSSLAGGASFASPLLGAQRREEDHVADRVDAGDEHHQPVHADPEPAGRRQAVLERLDVVVVDRLGLLVAAGLELRLRLEALAPGRPGR